MSRVVPIPQMLANIRIVLVETTHPGNIGAAARAMKNMCLRQLWLVNPQRYPSADATARASGAHDLLAQAEVCGSLDEALVGCRFVVGTSARLRSVQWPLLTPRACAARLGAEAQLGQVALLFGRESSGLTNAEMGRCHFLANIPTNPAYSSLNLAAAVQVLAYELHQVALAPTPPVEPDPRLVATADEMESFYRHLEQVISDLGFSDPRQSQALRQRLRRIFHRARPDPDELNILRGILSAAQGRKSMRNQ